MPCIKNKFIFAISFLFVIGFGYSKVSASTTVDQFSKVFISNYHYVDSSGSFGDFEYFTRKSDSQIAYCIEPGVSLSLEAYQGYYNNSINDMASLVNLSPEQLNYISLVAYYGWGYNGQYGYDWIVATQSLIWEYLGRNFQFTSQNSAANPWKYVISTPSEIQSKINILRERVNHHLSLPNFLQNHAKIPLNSSYEFISDRSLEEYTIGDCENCMAQINNNILNVRPSSQQNGSVLLKKRSRDWSTPFVVYVHNLGQNMLVPGNVLEMETRVTYEVVSGRLDLKKYDYDHKSCQAKKGGLLEGSVYKLYKENGTYVQDLVIDSNCNATATDLELGKYYIKEYQAGKNYELDLNSYFFELTIDKPKEELIVYDKMYLGQVSLKKIDSKTNTCHSSSIYASLKGAVYGIYNLDNYLLSTLTIGENCEAISERDLLLGNYYLKEIKPPVGYKKDEKKYFFSVTKENADDIIYIELKDDIYETKLIINKHYLTFNDSKSEEGAVFGIFVKSTNQKIASLKTNDFGVAYFTLPYGEYIIKQEKGKEGYHFVDDIYFKVDEYCGEISLLPLINKPFLGNLEFKKIDSITKQGLSGTLIEIYNMDNILVYRGITDSDGKIFVDHLLYGTYYIVEKKSPRGYILSKEKIYFDILEDRALVSVVMENSKKVYVPNTGMNTFDISCYSVLFLLAGIALLKYAKN